MFNDSDEAIKWAIRVRSTEIIDEPSINSMCGKPRRSTQNELLRGLSPQEAHQQANQILLCTRKIDDPVCLDYIEVRYCRSNDLEIIMSRVLAGLLYSGLVYRRGIAKIVLNYFGANYGIEEIRASLHCSINSYYKLRDQALSVMDGIHKRTMGEMDTMLISAGIVRGNYAVACA